MSTSHRLAIALLTALSGLLLLTASAAAGWFPLGDGPKAWRPIGPPLAGQRLVVLGDSVPAGTACSCAPFPTILTRDAARWSGRPAPLRDEATGGLTAARLAQQLGQPSAGLRSALGAATLVSITVGANDLDPSLATGACGGPQNTDCYDASRAALRSSLKAVLGRVRSLAPGARVAVNGYWNVFLSGAVGRQQGTTYVRTSDQLTREVNSDLAALSRDTGASYVDLYRPFRGDGDADDTYLLASDGDHPNARGHRVIATAVERAAGWRPPPGG